VAYETITDLAAESASIIYVLSGTSVSKATDGGYLWDNPIVVTGAGTGNSMSLLSASNLLVAGATGVAYSTDGGATWVYNATMALSGATKAVADKLATGGVITAYAGSSLYKYTIGTSVVFYNLTSNSIAVPTAAPSGMVINGSVIYAMTANEMMRSPITNYVWSNLAQTGLTGIWVATTSNILYSLGAGGIVYSLSDVFAAGTTTLTSPAAGFLDPINSQTGQANQVVFQWTGITNAPIGTMYQIQIALDGNFTQEVGRFNSLSDTTLLIVGPNAVATSTTNAFAFQSDTSYYWRVRAIAVYDSGWSKSSSFKIATLSPIELVSPKTGVADVSITPTFAWTSAQAATGYVIELADTSNFAIITYSHTTDQPVYASTEELDYGTVYYWRVKPTGPSYPTASTPYVTGIFTTMAKPVVTTTAPPITITQTTSTFTVEIPAQQEVIPTYLLWIIIGIGAILLVTLIVLILRTRRTS
jgi:hypothetical protein